MKRKRFSSTKQQNISMILALVKSEGPISRAEIARTTKLSVPAVSQLVSELLDMDLVEEVGIASSTGGRPARLLQINSQSGFYIGINVGVEKMTSAVVDAVGQIMVRRTIDTYGIEHPFFRLIGLIRDTLLATELSPESIQGIGVGVPGVVNPTSRLVQQSVVFDWENFDIEVQLGQCFRMPVWVGSAMEACIRGEVWGGLLRGVNHGLALHIDHDVYIGFLLHGQFFPGTSGAAGQLSPWMSKEMGLFDVASTSLASISDQLGQFIANLSSLLDLEQIVLSGKLADEAELLSPIINRIVQEQVPYPPKLAITELGETAGILGAVDGIVEMLNKSEGLLRK